MIFLAASRAFLVLQEAESRWLRRQFVRQLHLLANL
jgi:hypothetical protein